MVNHGQSRVAVAARYALLLLALACVTEAGAPYCMPNQSCYPNAAVWSSFAASLKGQLLTPSSSSWDTATKLKNPRLTSFVPAALVQAQVRVDALWRVFGLRKCRLRCSCATLRCVCPPLHAPSCNTRWSPTSEASRSLSSPQTASDVIATVAFVKQHNLLLSVKSTGHCYTGNCQAKSSLNLDLSGMIWVRRTARRGVAAACPHAVDGAGSGRRRCALTRPTPCPMWHAHE